ncbi:MULTISPECIES: N-acetylmuramoyl-L-alanine amidase [Chryseobacterium]|uniref:N-acetylmuramoyl-L-alanine amidase n=1 Tax=Chryseobacterium TaxID=59732 RepID=UPI0016276963|nr:MULTISPECIES: N-acetylmuramoyl-L-alanine amidase [Chryseobacterium]MDR6923075.1 putative chitinase [Chryseobacterium sp. 2987]
MEKRNPALVTWHLFKKVNGKFVPTNIKKKGVSSFTFNTTAYKDTFRIEAYLHNPEGRAPMALEIQPQPSDVPRINKVELKYIDDTPGTVFSFTEKLVAEAKCMNLEGQYLQFTLWEDDAKGSGHNAKNLPIDSKKEKVKNGIARVEFMLTKALMKKAMEGETDPKELEFYVTVEYYSHKKHATENKSVKNPIILDLPSSKPSPKPVSPKEQSKAKDSPAENKPKSKKEEKDIAHQVIDWWNELWDWGESNGTIKKDQRPTAPPPPGNSPAVIKEPKLEKKTDNCTCFCDRAINPKELKEMVIAMRKATFDEAGENFYKWNKDNLFTGGHEQFNDKSYEKFAEVLNKTFENYEITSCIRKIHFLGQCYHETGAFMKSVEGKINQEYSYDPYRGRGFIHLTLQGNYQKFKDNSGYDVVKNPKLVSTNIEIAAMSSGWYWKYNDKGNINPFADKDSVFDTSRMVNKPNATKSSSINGYNQRVNAINALKTVFQYPQNCCNLNKKEKSSKNELCPSDLEDCICTTAFNVNNGFIEHSRVMKNHVAVIEHGTFKDPKTSVQKIILHRTAGGTTQACINAFKGGRKNKKGGIDYYGTHFIVGKDGVIIQTANLSKVTWHCAGWNSKSVGIEVVGFAIDKNGKPTLGLKGQNPVAGWENLTEEQAKSVACLVIALLSYYNLDTSKIDCHEHLAAKEAGEGQIVYNAIKDYLK